MKEVLVFGSTFYINISYIIQRFLFLIVFKITIVSFEEVITLNTI